MRRFQQAQPRPWACRLESVANLPAGLIGIITTAVQVHLRSKLLSAHSPAGTVLPTALAAAASIPGNLLILVETRMTVSISAAPLATP